MKTPTKQVSKVITVPAPVKGINSYDSIVEMPPGYALILRNLFAQPYGVQVRRGYVQHVVGLPGSIDTLASHNGLEGETLYAFSYEAGDSKMYDVTAPNVVPTFALDGLFTSKWQSINFPNISGVNMIAVSGAGDEPIWVHPNGLITRLTLGDGTTEGTIAGPTSPKLFSHIYSHQKRVWFVEGDSTVGWYLPPDQVYGVANYFDFGPQWTRGGHLTQLITWTIDDGNGADDHLVAISSQGEVSVYQGTDPEQIDTWSLQGVYYVGPPVGPRAATRYGGDIAIVCQNGLVMLSNYLKSTTLNATEANPGKYIQQLVALATQDTGGDFGWQPFVIPDLNMFMINVPNGAGSAYQFVMNDITKAWSEFIGYEALCWELHQSLPFFGAQGGVYRAWEQYTDNCIVDSEGVLTRGDGIRWEGQTSYSAFENPVVNKHYKMVRPTIMSTGEFTISVAANVDFSFNSSLSPINFKIYEAGKWDEDLWDSGIWGGGLTSYHNWTTVKGIGFTVALRVLGKSSSHTLWMTTDWLYEPGGVI